MRRVIEKDPAHRVVIIVHVTASRTLHNKEYLPPRYPWPNYRAYTRNNCFRETRCVIEPRESQVYLRYLRENIIHSTIVSPILLYTTKLHHTSTRTFIRKEIHRYFIVVNDRQSAEVYMQLLSHASSFIHRASREVRFNVHLSTINWLFSTTEIIITVIKCLNVIETMLARNRRQRLKRLPDYRIICFHVERNEVKFDSKIKWNFWSDPMI